MVKVVRPWLQKMGFCGFELRQRPPPPASVTSANTPRIWRHLPELLLNEGCVVVCTSNPIPKKRRFVPWCGIKINNLVSPDRRGAREYNVPRPRTLPPLLTVALLAHPPSSKSKARATFRFRRRVSRHTPRNSRQALGTIQSRNGTNERETEREQALSLPLPRPTPTVSHPSDPTKLDLCQTAVNDECQKPSAVTASAVLPSAPQKSRICLISVAGPPTLTLRHVRPSSLVEEKNASPEATIRDLLIGKGY